MFEAERPGDTIANLRAVTQEVIRQDARHHSLTHRDGANAHAWIVAALRRYVGFRALAASRWRAASGSTTSASRRTGRPRLAG